MTKSTYKRLLQSQTDFLRNLRTRTDAKFAACGLTSECGGYPVNPTETEAYNAGFQRGCHWAWQAASNGKPVSVRWDVADGTYAGSGEQDGWNAAAEALK